MPIAVRRTSVRFLVLLMVLAVICGAFFYISQHLIHPSDSPSPLPSPADITVVLDAGHGGEDGGTSSADGALEKDLNLSIAFLLRDLLEEGGIRVVMTREEDRLLYDRNADYQGKKKKLDLLARKEIAEAVPSAYFVSLHMNSFPEESSRGLQVWYSKNHPLSYTLAEQVQSTVRDQLQPENHRLPKPATSSIFLLHQLHIPAILIECGFLSNREEASLLASKEYQKQLAEQIASAIFAQIAAAKNTTPP